MINKGGLFCQLCQPFSQLEILDATYRYLQVEVISALPEIITDQQYVTIALHLQKMLRD